MSNGEHGDEEADRDPDGADAFDLLVAYDESAAARRAARFAAQRAAMTGESVEVVHVGTDVTVAEMREAVEGAFLDHDVVVGFRAVSAGGSDEENVSVAVALAEVIADQGYELVFVGNEARGLYYQLTVGSVSEALIEGRNVPVCLVP